MARVAVASALRPAPRFGEVGQNPGAPHFASALRSVPRAGEGRMKQGILTAVCRARCEGAPAVEDWKKVLKAGSTLDPAGLARLAGIDISTDQPLLDTIDYIGSVIDEIERLTDEIDRQ